MHHRIPAIALVPAICAFAGSETKNFEEWLITFEKRSDIEKAKILNKLFKANNRVALNLLVNLVTYDFKIGREKEDVGVYVLSELQMIIPISYEFEAKKFRNSVEYRIEIQKFYLAWLANNQIMKYSKQYECLYGEATTENELKEHYQWAFKPRW